METPLVTGLRVMDEGVTVVNPATTMDFVGAGVSATNPSAGKATVTVSGSSGTAAYGESPTDNANGTYTLSHTPIAGTVIVYKNGARQNVGAGNDYTISGSTITRLDTYVATDVFLVDYQY